MLLPFLQVGLRFVFNPAYLVLKTNQGKEFTYKVTDIKVRTRHAKIASSVKLSIEEALQTKAAVYHMRIPLCRVWSIPKHAQDFEATGIFSNNKVVGDDRQTDWQGNAGRCWLRTLTDSDLLFQVPVILLAGLVLTSELHGTFDSSPHNFRPHNLTQIKVSVDSDIYPTSDGIRVDYDQIGGFVEGYLSLAHNRLLADTGITQSFETYKTGFCWYLFSLGKSVVARSVGRSVDRSVCLTCSTIYYQGILCPSNLIILIEFGPVAGEWTWSSSRDLRTVRW